MIPTSLCISPLFYLLYYLHYVLLVSICWLFPFELEGFEGNRTRSSILQMLQAKNIKTKDELERHKRGRNLNIGEQLDVGGE